MGILDKLDDAWDTARDAVADAGRQFGEGIETIAVDGVVGLGYDLFVQPYKDAQAGKKWYDALGSGLFNAVGDVGHVFGGAFQSVTSPLQLLNVDAPELLGRGYEVIDENAATAEILGGLVSEGHSLDRDSWAQARQIQRDNNVTLGGGLALLAMRGSIADQQRVKDYQEGRLYKTVARTTDIVAPLFLDPLVLAGKGLQAYRISHVVKPIKAGDKIDDLVLSQDVARFGDSIKGLTPAEIIQKFQHKDMDAVTAQILAHASNEGTLQTALLSLMGHKDAPAFLSSRSSTVAAQIERLKGQRDYLIAGGHIDPPYALTSADNPHGAYPPVSPQALRDTEAELNMWYDQARQLQRLDTRYNTMKNLPHTSKYTEARYTVLRSDWFQDGKTALPLRKVYQMNPKGLLHLDDPTSHTQVTGMLDHSALPPEVKTDLLNRYLDADGPMLRQDVLNEARLAAVNSILDKYQISDTDKAQIVKDMDTGMNRANVTIKSAAYDGKGRGKITILGEGEPQELHAPILNTQNPNLVALPDLLRLDRVARRYSPNFKVITPGIGRKLDMAEEELMRFQQLWKTSTLLRVAYPIRVVGEEQVRLMSEFGVMANMKYAGQGVMNKRQDWKVVGDRVQTAAEEFIQTNGRYPNPVEIRQIRDRVQDEYTTNERLRGARQPEYMGIRYSPSLGGEGSIFNTLIDSRALHDESWGRDVLNNDKTLNQMLDDDRKLKGTGEFVGGIEYTLKDGSINPQWERAWTVAVTRQIAHDVAARKVMLGESPEQILTWLRTPEGKAYQSKLHPYWEVNPEDWVDNLFGHVEDYVPTPALKEAVLNGRLTKQLAHDEFERWGERPVVHGEILDGALAEGRWGKAVRTITEQGFKYLAQQPTYVLSRSKAFDLAYRREMDRMLERHWKQRADGNKVTIDSKTQRNYERYARQEALKQTRKLLFDLSTESDMSHMMRFYSPFFNAFEEVLRTWGRLTVQNPAFTARVYTTWNSVDRSGLVHEDETTKEKYLLLDLPGSWNIGGVPLDRMRLSKQSFNTVLNTPGVGPAVAVPMSEILRGRPDLQDDDWAKFIFPYGVPATWKDAVSSKTMRNFNTWMDADLQDRRYLQIWAGIYATEMTDYKLGKRSTEPSREEIDDRARKTAFVKMMVDFVSPASTKFESPYQSFIDSYKRLQEQDASTADQKFYEQFGEDYFQLTYHINRNVAGVPATLEAWEEYNKPGIKELIAEHPEMGSIIIGDQAWAGEFNQAVNNWLRTTKVGPGRSENLQETRSPDEIIEGPKVTAGWVEFRTFMTDLNAEMDSRGLTRITEKGAADLKELKHDYIHGYLKKEFPEWYDDYTTWDMDASNKRAAALEEIAASPSLNGRTDIAGLREYLTARSDFMAELGDRKAAGGSGDLWAKSNTDLRDLWDGWTSELVLRNARFEPLYVRFFDNDHLAVK